jgi:hypothetical protein
VVGHDTQLQFHSITRLVRNKFMHKLQLSVRLIARDGNKIAITLVVKGQRLCDRNGLTLFCVVKSRNNGRVQSIQHSLQLWETQMYARLCLLLNVVRIQIAK